MNIKNQIIESIQHELTWYINSGKKTTPLKKKIANDFNISIEDANILVNTEMARIQIQNTLNRYKKSDMKYFEFFADTDNRTCNKCASLDGKRFKIEDAKIGVNAPPMHDGCRCCILPVVEGM